MRSTETPMIWVHATVDGTDHIVAVAMRERETLEEAMGRGACILLDEKGGNYASRVWSETMDFYEVDAKPPLMDGQIPGAIVRVSNTGTTPPRNNR